MKKLLHEPLVDRKICRKTQGRAEIGNSCLTTPGTCESCPDYVKPVKPQHFFSIDEVPRSLNEVLRMHWKIRADYLRRWKSLIRAQKYFLLIKKATGKRKVSIVLHHARMFDTDNAHGACKVIFDALKSWDLLVDDSPKWLESTVVQLKHPHKSRFTTILIEEDKAV